ncbi:MULTISPECIES: MFS transporter [unclassified Kitasatospora]|uniref:MFS transporter n=1 Tax=unclassified Kitasatospora TaxID=2633591 RepID=UPI00070EB03E|nr:MULTISPECIES: MFS transporter [unclassified Kitasatospora]KQV17152.1 MFS transporter [Kitasatospora sp. Root107]KRB70002.1 MFS transporter [Kitasatospora sp. Root187]
MTDDKPPIGVFEALRATPVAVRYLLGGVLVNQLAAFVQTFLVLYLTHRGMSAGTAGLALGAYSLGTVFGTVLGGEITHRLGARTTIVVAMTGSAPLVAVLPLLAKPGLLAPLLVAIALAGLFAQAYRPAAAVLLSDLMPERYQVMAFSMMRIALNTGAALAPLIAAGVILLDWDLLFWLDGATALVYAALAYRLLPRHAVPEKAPEERAQDQATRRTSGRAAYAAMLRDRAYLAYLAAVMLGTIAYVQSTISLPLEIVHDGYSTGLYSAVLTASSVVLITCELKITAYIIRIPTYLAVGLGHLVNSIGLAVYGLAVHSGVFVLFGAVLAVSGLMIAGPSMFAHPATFPAESKARYLGTMQAVVGLASAIGPLLGVFAWTRLGAGFWVLMALLNGLAGVLGVFGLKRRAELRAAAEAETGQEVVGGTV